MAALGSGDSGGEGSPPGSSGGSGRSMSKCRGLCSLSFFTGFGGTVSFGLKHQKKKTQEHFKMADIHHILESSSAAITAALVHSGKHHMLLHLTPQNIKDSRCIQPTQHGIQPPQATRLQEKAGKALCLLMKQRRAV